LWKVPYPYGRGAAIDAMAGIAAPLLVGFSLTSGGWGRLVKQFGSEQAANIDMQHRAA
jgi:hypothetical protein